MLAGAAALAASASGSKQPQGYYPRPQQAYAPPYQNPQQPQTAQTYPPCESACGQVARCNVMTYDACLTECRTTGADRTPGGVDQLNTVARSSCQQIQAAMPQQTQQAAASGRWTCSASGSWQKCEPNGTSCTPKSTYAMGVGTSEQLARGAAENQCTTYMTNVMTASFAFRTSVSASCRATSCSPR